MIDIKIDKFAGPLSLLLQIIEKEELDITTVNLAKIADEYLDFIQKSKDILPESLADFLWLASKLLYIKSKALLPYLFSEDDQSEVEDLAEKLKLYKEFVDLSFKVKKIIARKKFSFFRQLNQGRRLRLVGPSSFFPPRNVSAEVLGREFTRVLTRLETLEEKLEERALKSEVNIEERIAFIKNVVVEKMKINFSRILRESGSKVEIIVNFLAVLELAKQREIVFVQSSLFGEILLEKYRELNN